MTKTQQRRSTKAAMRLLQEGQLVLARASANGVRVDKRYVEATAEKMRRQIDDLERELKADKVFREWERVYGNKTNLGSRDQLADVLFNKMGMRSGDKTAGGGRRSTSKNHLEMIDDVFVRTFLQVEPLKNSLRTNIQGLLREMVQGPDGNWYVHPHFNLNTVVTFRSSSSMPNWQNFPKRNPITAALVRPAFIARPGRHLVEVDFAQIEVRVPACKTLANDPELIRYLTTPGTDMHRDQCAEIFMLAPGDVSKPARNQVKNNFVFASFYGSPYYNTAKALWDDIDRFDLKTAAGVPLKEHLRKKGITSRGACERGEDPDEGTFEWHVQKCERKLWDRLRVYKDWKRAQVDAYHRAGGMTMVTGFAIYGPHSATQIPNYGIQGPAFHCELWSLVELQREIDEHRLATLLLGEIHDSDQSDVPPRELDDWLCLQREIKTERLPKAMPWITVPLAVEMEVSPQDGNWYECAEWVETKPGRWDPKPKKWGSHEYPGTADPRLHRIPVGQADRPPADAPAGQQVRRVGLRL